MTGALPPNLGDANDAPAPQGKSVVDLFLPAPVARSRLRACSDSPPVPLLLLVGIPGSGKSSWARAFVEAHPRYRIVSTDAIRADLYGNETTQGDWAQIWSQVLCQWREGLVSLRQGDLDGIIYDATNARRRHRREAIAAARAVGFTAITLVWFDVPLSVALERNQGRSRQVPPDIIAAMARQIQGAPPSLAEGIDRILRPR